MWRNNVLDALSARSYYTSGFEKYLAISSGDTPDSLPIVGALAFLALAGRPDLFINTDS